MVESGFTATIRQHQDAPVIDLRGDVNAQAETALNSAFAEACAGGPGRVLLNFENVTYMNSTGIALVVALLAQARKTHLQLTVFGLSDHYRHIFDITRLSDFMNIHSDEASALAGAAQPGR